MFLKTKEIRHSPPGKSVMLSWLPPVRFQLKILKQGALSYTQHNTHTFSALSLKFTFYLCAKRALQLSLSVSLVRLMARLAIEGALVFLFSCVLLWHKHIQY